MPARTTFSPLSHDEVVHGKRSLIGRMPGDWWRQFAGARLLPLYAACHPGGMLSFMGNEFAQFIEWRDYEELEWFLLQNATHAGVQAFIRELNHVYRAEKALWEIDNSWDGFDWIDADNNEQGILSFVRKAKDGSAVLCVLNFRPESHESFRLGVPLAGAWQEILSRTIRASAAAERRTRAVCIQRKSPRTGAMRRSCSPCRRSAERSSNT